MAESKAKPKAKIAKPEAAKAKAPAPVAKAPTAKRSGKVSKTEMGAEQRYRMIAEAAYYIAERRNFAPGDAGADWAQAEKQIVALLNKK